MRMMRELGWSLARALVAMDFALLPTLARLLPLRPGFALAQLRGRLYAWLDLDWKSISVRQRYVSDRVRWALGEMRPTATAEESRRWLRGRFETGSREEWEAALTIADRLSEVAVRFEGAEAVVAASSAGRGLLLLAAHFESVPLGISLLGRLRLKVNLMVSNVVRDAQVPPAIQRFFLRKYEAMQYHFNGGFYRDAETQMKSLYAALRAGECVVVLGDGADTGSRHPVAACFFGRWRLFAPGALRLAERTGAALAAMVCVPEGSGSYVVRFSPPLVGEAAAEGVAAPVLYRFLEQEIASRPGGWWAAEQLPVFEDRGTCQHG